MVVSINRGTPIWTPNYYNPYSGGPQPPYGKGLKKFQANAHAVAL